VFTQLSGRLRIVCSNIGINCLYDLEGTELSANGRDLTATENPLTELAGKTFCPDELFLDALFKSLLDGYILG